MRYSLLFIFGVLLWQPLSAQSYQTAKPWAYWWWMGSAVNESDLSANLKTYADAGFGGLHIIPIYGVKGEEKNFIPYLSERWLHMLDFTVKEAAKNGLGVDMTLGTGWPFGGPQVKPELGAQKFEISSDGGKYILQMKPTGQQVKRAAPGGEGLVVDHFNKLAVDDYLKPFDQAFSSENYGVRAFYNDSYEVYDANWTPDFFDKFLKLRGYELREHLDVLSLRVAQTDREKRIWADYHQTLHDLLLTDFTKTWTGFASKYGKLSRNEAHGSPANILDLYALSDMPETEYFGSKQYAIPGYRQDTDYDPGRFGTPTEYVMKLASSPAHILGKKWVTSETATWNANHFKGALSQIKPLVDESFVAGVNHIFFHGVPYSPPSAAWPGWLFYASTNFNQNSHFFDQLPLLNRYIEVCQERLQNSVADNDVLVLLPFSDLWHSVGTKSKTHAVDVHNIANGGIFSPALLKLLDELTAAGISYDFVSDAQLYEFNIVSEKQAYLRTNNGLSTYKAVIIPSSEFMKNRTASRLSYFRQSGVPVVFEGQVPQKSFGFKNSEANDQALKKTLAGLIAVNAGQLIDHLAANQIKGEAFGPEGIRFVRKIDAAGNRQYFITNLSEKSLSRAIPLSVNSTYITAFDPLTEESGFLLKNENGLFFIDLKPGRSLFLTEGRHTDKPWEWLLTRNETEISGNWKVTFSGEVSDLPAPIEMQKIGSWAEYQSAAYFDGFGTYSTNFSLNKVPDGSALLSLGDVRESAEVTLNGIKLQTAWSLPFEIEVPAGLLRKENKLEVRVRNTSANRMRKLDAEGVNWKKFYDINFVDITYKPFDATRWSPQPSGLLGPVLLKY